jgi:hypothetical protein
VLKSQANNVLISPLSVKVLLTLLAEAAGQTVDSKTRKVSEHCDTMQVFLCHLKAGRVSDISIIISIIITLPAALMKIANLHADIIEERKNLHIF